MIKLSAKIRKEAGRKTSGLKNSGRIPAVVYGHKVKNVSLDVDYKEFQKVYNKAGYNSLVELLVEGEKEPKTVLIHELQKDSVSDKVIHIDFFEISAKEEVAVKIPLVLEGNSAAVKDLGGTLVKNISELEVKALPQNLPHEIHVNIDKLNTFEDRILVKDIILPKDVRAVAKPDEIAVSVSAPAKVEEELAKELEEKVEDVGKVEKKVKEEEVLEEEKPASAKGSGEAKPEPKK